MSGEKSKGKNGESRSRPHCELLALRTLHSRKALFEEGAFPSIPQGAGPAAAKAEWLLHSWGSQLDLLEEMETGEPLSPSSPARSTDRSVGSEARSAATSPHGTGSSIHLSSSEEVDVKSPVEEPFPQSLQYEELLEVVTRTVSNLNIDWPAEEKAEPQRSKLDERLLRSNIVRLGERGYKAMPRVEQTLSPSAASSLKAPSLPSKPLCTTSALVGKGTAEGSPYQGGAGCTALHCVRLLPQLVRQSPAGSPLQDFELTFQPTPEASLEQLVPLVDYLATWKLLPNVSAWVLRTVEKGYSIQFGAPPPSFNGVFSTLVGPKQALVMEQEVETLLRKEAIEVVPPQDRESRFYSRYFIVPKKDGGLRPILDLRRLNQSVMRMKFRMLTVKQEDPEVCFQGRSIPVSGSSVRALDPCVVPGQTPLVESRSCSWASEHRSRRPVETRADAWGMDASPQDESLPRQGQSSLSSPILAGLSMVLGPDFSPRRFSIFLPRPWVWNVEAVGVAPEGAQLIASRLSTEVVETILQSRAPSAKKLYALK
ncbi:Exocyst complex protein exo70 [Labeo rohita]|uniref:Exocyst complex protein exo70 n=1 Tax=Labeo rohita TaxID=84645 RepID=A0ABQ8MQW4_LABRO|nr:Exocyst complex protein exo70 [Labeo rohita]